jgi:hypothetical protein
MLEYRMLNASILVALLSWWLGSATHAADTWRAGSARINITPAGSMWMSGYASRDRPSEGKLTDLWAKALVLEDTSGHRAVLVTLDLIGIDRELSQSVCRQVMHKHGLARHQIAICSSHTHTGPALQRNLAPLHYVLVDPEQQKHIEDYTESLVTNIVAVIARAIETLAPCKVSVGSGQATFAVNRRENSPESIVPQGRTAGTLRGPFDHDVPVLVIHDAAGAMKTLVFGYACHATTLSSYQWSGDYPGFAQLELEQNHPGCMAMFWAGCGADQNPLPRRSVELARHYGRRLADAVDAVLLTSQLREVTGQLHTSYEEIDLPLSDVPSREQVIQDTASNDRYVAARARLYLDILDAGEVLPGVYPYPVAVWSIGDAVQWIVLGGEVVVDYAIRLKAELPDETQVWVAGYANDVMAYIPSRRVLLEGGYEGGGAMVYYGLPSPWAVGVENLIVDEVRRQVLQIDD